MTRMQRWTLWALALVVSACGSRTPVTMAYAPALPLSPRLPVVLPVPYNPPTEPDVWEPVGTGTAPPRFTTNEATLYVDGPEIFPAMERLLQRAERLIQIDYYIFSGKQAERLAAILKRKVSEGVTVELMLDPHLGVLPELKNHAKPVINDLLANGVTLRAYPLDTLRSQVGKDSIVDHSKVIVVDGRDAMCGGMNIADPFYNNHDLMVELSGPAARDLGQNLRHDYVKGTTFKAQAIGGEPAQIRVNTTGLDRNFNKEAVLAAIGRARRSVHVLMFQLTYAEVIDALKAAQARGVDVRVLLDPGVHDSLVPIIKKAPRGFPNLPAALELKKADVPVRWYTLKAGQDHMHAKSAVIDGTACFVGSTNWTTNGFTNNNETSLEIVGGSVPARLQQVFLHDWEAQSEPVEDDQSVLSGLKSWIIRKTYFP